MSNTHMRCVCINDFFSLEKPDCSGSMLLLSDLCEIKKEAKETSFPVSSEFIRISERTMRLRESFPHCRSVKLKLLPSSLSYMRLFAADAFSQLAFILLLCAECATILHCAVKCLWLMRMDKRRRRSRSRGGGRCVEADVSLQARDGRHMRRRSSTGILFFS